MKELLTGTGLALALPGMLLRGKLADVQGFAPGSLAEAVELTV